MRIYLVLSKSTRKYHKFPWADCRGFYPKEQADAKLSHVYGPGAAGHP